MRRALKRLPTPAMIVAIVALIAALGGSAVAGGVLTPKKYKNTAVRGPLTYVSTTALVNTTSSGGTSTTVSASCPGGFEATGGSARTTNPSTTSNFFLFQDYPTDTGWTAQVYAGLNATTAEPVVVTAICAKVKSTTGTLTPPTL